MQSASLLIAQARQLVYFEPLDPGQAQPAKWRLQTIPDGFVAISGSEIIALGAEEAVMGEISVSEKTRTLDASRHVVTPGLIDSHTHPVFFATREHEFELRGQGKSYEEIAAAGGGIRSSVASLRQASRTELKQKVRRRLHRFLSMGTTTIEAKSGYGLSLDDELKSLEILAELGREGDLEIVPTFLGAHEVPPEFRDNREGYIQLLVNEMIPAVAQRGLAEFCDIFCESGVYSVDEARRILQAALSAGLKIKLHADQLHLTGATLTGIELGAVSTDHLEQIDEETVAALAQSKTIAGLLPGSVFFLGSHQYPPARQLLDAGARVALATDFNPGSSMTQSMPLMMSLGCLFMGMTPAEALMASTVQGAASICREETLGNLLPGYQADLVLWDADDYRQLPYYYGVNLAAKVFKRGVLVFEDPGPGSRNFDALSQ